jgi:nitric-oxide synthase
MEADVQRNQAASEQPMRAEDQPMGRCPVHDGSPLRLVRAADSTATGSLNLDEVWDFFRQYRAFTNMSPGEWRKRLDDVEGEIDAGGTYRHTSAELIAGAKLAWRHHTRCIGKLYWRSLTIRDCRHLTSALDIRDACLTHLSVAANGGHVRPVMSVFAPDSPLHPGPRVRNSQLVAYAGHRRPDGSILGDPASVELTELAQGTGWSPGRPGRFDLLPLVIETADGGRSAHSVPPELAHEVPIDHPTIGGLSTLDLRWYGFPTVSDMSLSIGGITYPLAPFSGWYVAPEVGARDLTDPSRYNLLPDVAAALGLDTGDRRSLWRDRALIELTTAVLWSYERAGIRMDDHHTASDRFHRYTLAERRKGRDVDAEWAWIVPPISGSATAVFHDSYPSTQRWPNFFRRTV